MSYPHLAYTDHPAEHPSGGALPAVLLHGWLGSSRTWDLQLPALRRHRRTIAVDLRGHGRSPAPDSTYSLDELAGDVERLLAELDPGPVILVGHSYGASLATVVAVHQPAAVHALVLISPDYAGDPGARPSREWLERLASPAGEALTRTTLAGLEGPHTPPELRERHWREAARVPGFVRARMLRAHMEATDGMRFRPGSDAWLTRRRQPVLALHRDRARAEVEEQLRQHRASRVICLPEAGHWLHHERPDLWKQVVQPWLVRSP
ncbi:alpha/beta hydrolase [Micromonospora sp. NBC_01699]|uniref:alpha/beta fold hydrolase n=1 Tax=Micromonospora sp. NBC_01699 TaxID=2975984 RepID=UPI002E31AC10|nr:alpha/beta hydrolase [Micromonospora sp. NBC_01699]